MARPDSDNEHYEPQPLDHLAPNTRPRRLVGAHGLGGEGGEVMWSGKTLGRNPTTQWPAGDGLRLSVFRERVGGI